MKSTLSKWQLSLKGIVAFVSVACVIFAFVRLVTAGGEDAAIDTMRNAGWFVETYSINEVRVPGFVRVRCRYASRVSVTNYDLSLGRPTRVAVEGTPALDGLKRCSGIRRLDVAYTDISEESFLEMRSLREVNSLDLSGSPSTTKRVMKELAGSENLQGVTLMDSHLADDDLLPLSKSNSLRMLVVEGDVSGAFLSGFEESGLLSLCLVSDKLQPDQLVSLNRTKVDHLFLSCKPAEIPIDALPETIRRVRLFWDKPLDDEDRGWLKAVHEKHQHIYVDVSATDQIAVIAWYRA
ncbi:hypothetical protein GC197_03205 [bacterium]|nr:hypothetical protein [bacterium]